jgi:hypothetical protein
MRVLELKGYKSLKALNAFHTLMLGLKMLPAYCGESYEDFFAKIETLPEASQEKLIREAALFVELQKDEVESLICFCTDANGVPYTAENLKSLGPDELHECIVQVCLAISKIKINFVSESEKKNLKISQSTLDESSQKILN